LLTGLGHGCEHVSINGVKMLLNDFIKNEIEFLTSQLEQEPEPEPEPIEQPDIFKIATNVSSIDGRKSPYNEIKPGDVIEIVSGKRTPLEIKNLQGTPEKPIIIRNESDGIIDIDTAYGWYGFWIRNCHYFRLTGTGNQGVEYGIKITRAQNNGIIFQNKTDNFEIDHVEINRVDSLSGGGIGIQGQTVKSTTADYDYNNDGKIDNNDLVLRENYIQRNWHIHHMKIDGGIYSQIGLGLYVGNSNYLEEQNPLVENCHIHDVIIHNVSGKALQVGSVVSGFDVHDINVRNCTTGSLSYVPNPVAISINPGCNGELHNCIVIDCGGYGIGWLGTGGKIYNNLIVRCGRANTYFDHGIYVAYKDPYKHDIPTYVYNNTIVDPVDCGIVVGGQLTGTKIVRNNIIVRSAKTYKSIATGTVYTNNIESPTVNLLFTNPIVNDYSLVPDSPAVNAGFDMACFGLVEDIDGNVRPSGTAYDAGAYELK
jgi:hypothetical protein